MQIYLVNTFQSIHKQLIQGIYRVPIDFFEKNKLVESVSPSVVINHSLAGRWF